jgi:hypothetical protein
VVYAYDLGNTGVSGREAGDAGRTPDGPGTRDASDAQAGFDVLDHFQRFSQKNDIYSRAFWD